MAQTNCCCACSGMGVPLFEAWTRKRNASWLAGTNYLAGDLVWHTSSTNYYIAKITHYAIGGSTEPPNATYWTTGTRQIKCLYVELDGISRADCRVLWNIYSTDIDPAVDTGTIRLDEVSGSPPTLAEKYLIRQRNVSTHTADQLPGEDDDNGLQYYDAKIGDSCHWFKRCSCSGSEVFELKFVVENAIKQRFIHRGDSAHTDYIIRVEIVSETEIEVVIYAYIYFSQSSAYDGNADREDPPTKPLTTSNTPCNKDIGIRMIAEVFRGQQTIPESWIDGSGEPTALVVSNNYSCADIGTRLSRSDIIATLDVFVAGGNGTVTIQPPFADPWSVGDSFTSCSAIPAPNDEDCHKTGGPEPSPPVPPIPPRDPRDPRDPRPPRPKPPKPEPPRKPKWRKVNSCNGGVYGWTPDGGYEPGTVLLIQNSVGTLICVVVSADYKYSLTPPGRMLTGVISNFGQRACHECRKCYRLQKCDESGNLFTRDDLSGVVGRVVDIGGECWTVTEDLDCPQEDHPSPGDDYDTCGDCECQGDTPDSLPAGDPPSGYASSYTLTIGGCADCETPCTLTLDWDGAVWIGADSNANGSSSGVLKLDSFSSPNRWEVQFVCGVPGGDNDATYERVCESITGSYELVSQGHDCSGSCLFGDTATVS